ncbi:MAG: SCP2 sterol-binding domain-containing protein [Candidatus Helarchaeota archaeon]|nr:SCP2 sterol-binding domain-containing protein [Candidatus Helarchaeota archaeon]
MDRKQILQAKALCYFVGKGLEVISRTNEDFQELFEELDGIFQWIICEEVMAYMVAKKGVFNTTLDATNDAATVTFAVADFDKARDILTGKIDGTSAYMAGDLNIMGDVQMGMKFAQLSEFLVNDLSDLVD